MLFKILLTLAVIAAVWFGYRLMSRARDVRRQPPPPSPGTAQVQDMVKCPVCGIWQAGKGTASCGRSACPY